MEITTRRVGKCKILDCSGKLILGPATATLREAIRKAVRHGTSKVVLNLGDVFYIDSSGLGELISGHFHLENHGDKLVLLRAPKII